MVPNDKLGALTQPRSPDPAVAAAWAEVRHILDDELARLPDRLRSPLVLCYLKECTHDQAAAELRWPVGTVRSRLARGRELLRERLTRRGCAPTAAILGVSPGLSLRPGNCSR